MAAPYGRAVTAGGIPARRRRRDGRLGAWPNDDTEARSAVTRATDHPSRPARRRGRDPRRGRGTRSPTAGRATPPRRSASYAAPGRHERARPSLSWWPRRTGPWWATCRPRRASRRHRQRGGRGGARLRGDAQAGTRPRPRPLRRPDRRRRSTAVAPAGAPRRPGLLRPLRLRTGRRTRPRPTRRSARAIRTSRHDASRGTPRRCAGSSATAGSDDLPGRARPGRSQHYSASAPAPASSSGGG